MNKKNAHIVGLKIARLFMANLKGDKNAASYLKSRGLSMAWCIENGLGYARNSWSDVTSSLSSAEKKIAADAGFIGRSNKDGTERFYDFYRDRIIFPILDNDGYMVGFGGRYIGSESSESKYINTRDTELFNKSSLLYNLHRASELGVKRIVVVEGYMDVMSARNAGINNLTAVMGTAFTAEHAKEVIRKGINDVAFCFDGDKAGLGAARKTLAAISTLRNAGVGVSYTFLPDGMDPDDYIQKHGGDALDAALAEGVSPELFLANSIIEAGKGANSIDKTISVGLDGLNSAVDNGLDVSQVWESVYRSHSDLNMNALQAVVKRRFSNVLNNPDALNSSNETEKWQGANYPT